MNATFAAFFRGALEPLFRNMLVWFSLLKDFGFMRSPKGVTGFDGLPRGLSLVWDPQNDLWQHQTQNVASGQAEDSFFGRLLDCSSPSWKSPLRCVLRKLGHPHRFQEELQALSRKSRYAWSTVTLRFAEGLSLAKSICESFGLRPPTWWPGTRGAGRVV